MVDKKETPIELVSVNSGMPRVDLSGGGIASTPFTMKNPKPVDFTPEEKARIESEARGEFLAHIRWN